MSDSVIDPTRISMAELIGLSKKSRGLSLKSGIFHASQAGDYQSVFKGRGMEYDESRLYQAGDDIRSIDWRVTARTGKAHTKLFCEERERPVHVWVDFRLPMLFATKGKFKSVIAAELASLFAWIACQQGDRIGGGVFSEHSRNELKPQRGKPAVLNLLRQIVAHSACQKGSDSDSKPQGMAAHLGHLRRLIRPGSMVILLSDFRGFDNEASLHLIRLRQHNELIMVHIYDWLEAYLPPSGRYRMRNGGQELLIDTSNRKRIIEHESKFKSQQEYLLKVARRCQANLLSCRTEDDPAKIIRDGLRTV